MRIAVFAYNFPHKKTQDFLCRLFLESADVRVVLAADPVELGIPSPSIRIKPRHTGLVHPKVIAERFNWRYEVVEHNGAKCADRLKEYAIDLGIIAGARVLKEPVIGTPRLGIVNFHPGLIPEVRGLDALQWAIYEGHPIGNTAHLIDERVDAGRLLLRRELRLFQDDTLLDLSLRLHEQQIEMLAEVVSLLKEKDDVSRFPLIGKCHLHRKMPADLELQLPKLWAARASRLAGR